MTFLHSLMRRGVRVSKSGTCDTLGAFRDITGNGPIAVGGSVLVLITSLAGDRQLGWGLLESGTLYQTGLATVLLILAAILFYQTFRHLVPAKHNTELVTSGPYSWVRHPRYSILTFLVYPAVSLLLHSTGSLLSTVVVYLIFRAAAQGEERRLIQIFGASYETYRETTPAFVPFGPN